jgi:hypothetical protein
VPQTRIGSIRWTSNLERWEIEIEARIEADLEIIERRYGGSNESPDVPLRAQPAGRLLIIEGSSATGHPIMLTEFGGMTFAPLDTTDDTWGYSRTLNSEGLRQLYSDLLAVINSQAILCWVLLHPVCGHLSGGQWAP